MIEWNGENLPAHSLKKDYNPPVPNIRICVECGGRNGMVVENSRTGEVLYEIDKCHDCFWKNAFTIREIKEQIILTTSEESQDASSKQEYTQ
jgi:hypothetical protein